MGKKDAMFMLRHIVTKCDMSHAIFLDFKKNQKKNLQNETFNTYLAFQMNVLERLENVNVS